MNCVYLWLQAYSDQESLVLSEELENGLGYGGERRSLPDWAGLVEEVQYNVVSLREKTKRVAALQSNLVRRPSLDDNTEEERQLAAHTNEIRRVSACVCVIVYVCKLKGFWCSLCIQYKYNRAGFRKSLHLLCLTVL